jgi:cytochrome c
MRELRTVLVSLAVLGLFFSVALAETAEERGRKLFTDSAAFGGKKACSACHPGGRGLKGAGMKKTFHIMGGTQNSLEEAVNACIVNANRGKALPEDSGEMKDMVAYIKSLGKPGY